MNFSFIPTRSQLKIFSAICANLTTAWFLGVFVTKDLFTVIGNIVSVVVSWYLAVKTEELSARYD